MKLAFTLLSIMSNKSSEEVKETFTEWYKEKGKIMLALDFNSSRTKHADRVGDENDSDYLSDSPHPNTPYEGYQRLSSCLLIL